MAKQIALHGTCGEGKFSLVDDDDFERLNAYRWLGSKKGYAHRLTGSGDRRVHTLLHREVMRTQLELAPKGTQVDHINMDKLDNRRSNLRLATPSQNRWNSNAARGSSSFTGVSWRKEKGLWEAYIGAYRVRHRLGYFATELEAAYAYNQAAIELHGEFVRLNDLTGLLPDGFELPDKSPREKTSKYRGVNWDTSTSKWLARITVQGETHRLGLYDSEEESFLAYQSAAQSFGLPSAG